MLFPFIRKKKSKLITASSDIHKVWTQVKGKWGEWESDQERTSIVLVTSLFFEMRTRGGKGEVTYLVDLSLRTLWMVPYQLMTPLQKCNGKKSWIKIVIKKKQVS